MDAGLGYQQQVRLLLRTLPTIAEESSFALKGGTAINLFIRDLPRLSVDIDLAYVEMDGREIALSKIRSSLTRISEKIKTINKVARVTKSFETRPDSLKIIVRENNIQIKIEVSPVIRGSVYPDSILEVKPSVEETFGYASIKVQSFQDLYAGKLCAALDRQHPRDLFDVKILLDNEGIDEKLKKAFLVYLMCHNRPIFEILNPNRKEIEKVFQFEFLNMSNVKIEFKDLIETRETMIAMIQKILTENDKKFLLSFKSLNPEWSYLGIPGVENLPAVKWKLLNLEKVNNKKKDELFKRLEKFLAN